MNLTNLIIYKLIIFEHKYHVYRDIFKLSRKQSIQKALWHVGL